MIRRLLIAAGFVALLAPTWAAALPVFVMMAPPRLTEAKEDAVYKPIAKFLSEATGAKFVFRYTRNWLVYMQEVKTNAADMYFDGPDMIGWREAHFHDRAAAHLRGKLKFTLVVRHGVNVTKPDQLAGDTVCAFSPPNLATLVLESLFPNPDRQPYIHVIHSLPAAVRGVLKGTCRAALVPAVVFQKFNKRFPGRLTVAYRAKPLPNQGFSMSSRIPRAIQNKIIKALLSPEGERVTERLRARFANRKLVRSHSATYLPARRLLNLAIGF